MPARASSSTSRRWPTGSAPAAATLMPLVDAIRAHVFAAERIHADDTTVPVLAKGKTRTGRLWTYVRDDRPFGGRDPPAAVFFYSPDRGGEHPEQHLAGYAGLMQADAYAGFNRLYEAGRKPGPIIEAACWAHARRKFFDLARLNKAPIAIEAVERIDALFAIEREINGLDAAAARCACAASAAGRSSSRWRPGCASSAPSSPARARSPRPSPTASSAGRRSRASSTMAACACPTTPPSAQMRAIAVGRQNWTFAGSDEGGQRAAAIYTLIETAKLNDVDPQAWLADVLARLQDHPAKRIDELLPWNWKRERPQKAAA